MDRHQEKSVAEKLRNKVIAASITTGVGIAALTGCAPNAEAKPQETTISASPEATEAKNYDHLFAHAEDYTIPAGLNAEELGTVILDKYTEAINQSSQYDIFDYGIEVYDIGKLGAEEENTWAFAIDDIVEKNLPAIGDGLLVENYESNPNLQAFLNSVRNDSVANLGGFVFTANQAGKPYRSWMEPTGPIVELNDADNNPATRILEIPLTYGENATQSGVSKLDDSISGTFHVRISEENGYAKITDWLQVR